jgi:putative membrane protein
VLPATALPILASALAVLVGGMVVIVLQEPGPLSAHMATHIALMNVVAPFGACLFARDGMSGRTGAVWAFTLAQLALLWAWHAPALQRQVLSDPLLQWIMHASLLAIAFCFWSALQRLHGPRRWHVIPVLLLTAKLSCLLGVLLIFAPRLLYEVPAHEHLAHTPLTGMEDQQLAGLIMVTACPLSYLVAGVIIAARLLRGPAHGPARSDAGLSSARG